MKFADEDINDALVPENVITNFTKVDLRKAWLESRDIYDGLIEGSDWGVEEDSKMFEEWFNEMMAGGRVA